MYCIHISKKYLKQSILWYHGMVIRNLVSHTGAASPPGRRSSPHRAAVSEMMIGTPSLYATTILAFSDELEAKGEL